MRKRIIVTRESETGRNTRFKDMSTGSEMTRAQFVDKIESGRYDEYYVRTINGLKTPCDKPDGNQQNNLG